MTTKHRIRRQFRIELRERDHLPPHVHLTGGGVDVLIELATLRTDSGAPAACWPRHWSGSDCTATNC